MGSRVLRTAVLAAALLGVSGPAIGLAPAASAHSDAALTTTAASNVAYDVGWPRDISWPQCGGPYPPTPAYGIVGVNGGIVFSANPCLAEQLTWAGGAAAGFYANTGNPGPALSSHWPLGQTLPMACDPATPDSAACAYDYGYNAAADSYANAGAGFSALGLTASPAASTWWLDVETANSWQDDVSLNIANLQGAVDYLTSVAQVASVGFYSTAYQWGVITGGTSVFAAHPSWVAGASDALDASLSCGGTGFTGGGIALAQYPSGGFDADLRCAGGAHGPSGIGVSPAAASVAIGKMRLFTAVAVDQFGQVIVPQPAISWTVSGGGTIAANGVFTAGGSAGGPYTVTASSGGLSGTASVAITPAPVFTTIAVAPASAAVPADGAHPFSATALDQFGNPLVPQPAISWTLSGGGTISGSGLFTAASAAGGPFTVSASSGSVSGSASVTVTPVGDVTTAVGAINDASIAYGLTTQPPSGSYTLDGMNDAVTVAVQDAAGTAIGSHVTFGATSVPAGIVSLAPDRYDALRGVWNFTVTCHAAGSPSVTLTASSARSNAVATTGPLALVCANVLTPSAPGMFAAAPSSITVAANGSATVSVAVRDEQGLPAPDGTPVLATSDGTGAVIGSGGVVGAATTFDGMATFTYLAPAEAGSTTLTVSVANATPSGQTIPISVIPASPPVRPTAATASGVTASGPFTTATTIAGIGAYVTIRLSFGAAAAGRHVGIEMARKTGGAWGRFAVRTTRVADPNGTVFLHWRSSSAAWLSIRGALDGVVSNAVQVRWR